VTGKARLPLEGEIGESLELEAEEVLPAPPGHPRFPLLDSIRALAAISVLLVHVGIFTGGFAPWYKQLFAHLDFGVPVFFLLSGFLLYRPMLAARVSGLRKQRLSAYARNRFVRILPAYWVVLTVAALVPGFYGAFSGNWWVYYGLLQNFPVFTAEGVCAVNGFDCGLPVAWSLSVEIFFYLLLPVYAFAMAGLARFYDRSRWIVAELSGLALITAVSLYIQSSTPASDLDTWLFFSPLGRGWWFALGMAIAVISVAQAERPETIRPVSWVKDHFGICWLIAAALYCFTAIVVLDPSPSLAFPVIDNSDYLVSVIVFGISASFILLPAVFGSETRGFVQTVLRHPVLVWLGLISYGIFLWHYPVIGVLSDLDARNWVPSLMFPVIALLTFVFTVILAAISFYLIERPLMRWARGHRQSEPAGG